MSWTVPVFTGAQKCDVSVGPCACGAFHTERHLGSPMPKYGEPMTPSEMTAQIKAESDDWMNAPLGDFPPEFTREMLFALHLDLTTRALQLMRKKNADYSHAGPFMNFTACEAYGITAEDGLITRMSDKLSRLASIFRKGAQVSESEEDALIDLINYSVCLAGLRRSKNK